MGELFRALPGLTMLQQRWNIRLLGGISLDNGSGVVVTHFATRKTALLLGFLSVNMNREHSREMLADLLWQDIPTDAARHSLRQAVSSLRRQLEPPGTPRGSVLSARGNQFLRINTDAVTVDTARFEALLHEASPPDISSLRQAVALYNGELLHGFYEDWVLTERRRFEEMHRAALVSILSTGNESADALPIAHRLASLYPLDEDAQFPLIRLYGQLKRPEEAKQYYASFCERLQDQVGRTPSNDLDTIIGTLSAIPTFVQPALPPLTKPPDNASNTLGLPCPLTRFFGRDKEKSHIHDLLAGASPSRLVTLTGSGGNGKTRLAIEVGHSVAASFPGTTFFISLVEDTGETLLLRIRAKLVSAGLLPVPPPEEILSEIVGCFAKQHSLLILDNFEQTADGTNEIVKVLLERTPLLSCLVTSRKSLGLAGEQEVPIAPLPTPTESMSPTDLLRCPSVQLFIDRASSVRPDFQITERNAKTMQALMLCLDGIPLAIELAAARARALSPAQILDRLQDRFAFLQSRDPNAPARHRTLFAAIDGSVRLLPQQVRRLFLRLSVFRGGWTLETATKCAGANTDNPNVVLDALERLGQAVLIVTVDNELALRFRMLDTLREYASAELTEEDRRETESRYATCFVELAEHIAKGLALPGQAQSDALSAFDADRENLHASYAILVHNRDRTGQLRLVSAMALCWVLRGEFRHGRQTLVETFAETAFVTEDVFPGALRLRSRIADAIGTICAKSGDFAEAEKYSCESLAISRHLGDDAGIARSLNNLGSMALDQLRWKPAITYLREAVEYARKTGRLPMVSAIQNNLALSLLESGDLSAAEDMYQENLLVRHGFGDTRGVAITLLNLAEINIRKRDGNTACKMYQESLRLYRESVDMPQMAIALEGFGEALLLRDDPDSFPFAAFVFGSAQALRHQIGAPRRPEFQAKYPDLQKRIRDALGDTLFHKQFDDGFTCPQDTALQMIIEFAT